MRSRNTVAHQITRTSLLLTTCWAGIALLQPANVRAQVEAERIVDGGCETCRIQLDFVVRLGDQEGSGGIGMTAGIVQNSNGDWIVTHQFEPSTVQVYDSTGRFLRRMGRSGAGPGEFRSAGKLILQPGDSLSVFDAALARVVRFSPDGKYVRDDRLPIQSIRQVKYVDPEHYIINGDLRTQQKIGLPLHLVTSDGRIVRSFGSTDPVARRDRPTLHSRMISDPTGGSLWLANTKRYVLEKWTVSGELEARLERTVTWFEPHDRSAVISEDTPPPPLIRDIMEDEDGIVWVVVRVADARWKEAVYYRGAVQNTLSVYTVADPARYHDSIIEAIDVRSGRVLATARFDGSVHAFVDRGRFAVYTLDAKGVPYMDIYSMSIDSSTNGR